MSDQPGHNPSAASPSSSRRPRMNWGILNRLKPDAASSSSSSSSSSPNPEALLHHLDNAISNIEYAQASRHLSMLFGTTPLSPQSNAPKAASPLPILKLAPRPMSRFSPLRQEPPSTLQPLHAPVAEDASPANRKIGIVSREDTEKDELHKVSSLLSGSLHDSAESETYDNSVEIHDAQAADDAYRAGCSALLEKKTELALMYFKVACKNCPPDKHFALAKIQRLIEVTSQILEKQESSKTLETQVKHASKC